MTQPTEANANRANDPSTRRRRYEFFGSGPVQRVCFVFLPRLLFLSYLGLTAMGLAQMSAKKSLAPDFVLPWAASSLALSGHPQDVYVQDRQWAAEKAAAHNADVGYTYWSYPPTYLVVALPTALIPYRWSLLIWLAATLTAYCFVIWAIVPDPDALWIALAFPGTALNALAGQNGFLTTALFGAGLLLLRKKPIPAGVMFGLLTFKPQLGLMVPLVLIATRRWRAIAAAAFTAIAFAALSLMMFGVGTWAAFLHSLPESSRQLNNAQRVGKDSERIRGSSTAGVRIRARVFGPGDRRSGVRHNRGHRLAGASCIVRYQGRRAGGRNAAGHAICGGLRLRAACAPDRMDGA